MTTGTSVPAPTFGDNGFVAPAESDILAGVQADNNAAFGGNLNPALETPQGQLASSLSAIIGNAYDQFVQLTQQMDPAYSSGRMQDGIGRIYFLERKAAESTIVTATCVGSAGVSIPQGALALATDGNLYAAVNAITIPISGTIDASFACATTGPIPCLAGSLNVIYKAIPGWDSINNAADGIIGTNVESREDFEFRREQSVFLNSVGSNPAVRAAVMAVSGVLDAYVIDNPTASPATIGGVTLAANALYVGVAGGDAQLVAQAIWSKKAPGAPYYAGNTSETVYDTSAGYGPPYPTYTVVFETVTALSVYIAVTLANNSNVPPDYLTQIQTAILAAFTGADGGQRVRIGTTVYASRYYSAVASLGSWVQIVSIFVGSAPAPSAVSQAVDIDQMPTTVAANITATLV